METENVNKKNSKLATRNIWEELRIIGLTHDQCNDVKDLIDKLAIKLAMPPVSNRFNYKSFIIGCMVGATICIGILYILL